jgi:TonB-dependent siderophore receptor
MLGRNVSGGVRRRWLAALMATTGIALLQPTSSRAADTTTAQSGAVSFDIPAQPMTEALIQFGRQAKLQTSADAALIQNLRSQAVRGRMTWQDAIAALLAGSGLTYRLNGSMVVIEMDPAAANGVVPLSPLIVEGEAADALYGDLPLEPGGFKAEYQSSATKTPQTIKETPQAIGVVTQDNMKQRQVQGLGQAVETIAGVTQGAEPGPFAGRNVTGFATYQIRGVTTEAYYDVREDGFLAPAQTGTRDLAPYERVEVVKGPSSTLYGRGSAGGFINLVRKKPLSEFQVEFDASAGSYDFYRGEGDITGPLFDSDRARARMVVAYENAGSFVDGVKSHREVVAPSFELDVTESTRLLLHATYQGDQFIPHYGLPLQTDGEDFKAPKVRRSLHFGVPQGELEDNNRDLASGGLQLDQEIEDNWLATLRLAKSWSRGNQHADNYAYGALQPNGDVTVYGASDEKVVDVWSGELLVNGKFDLFGGKTNLTFGTEASDMDYTRHSETVYVGLANIYDDNFDDLLTPGVPVSQYDQDTTFRSHGIFGQVQYRMFDRLGILLGGRYDWTRQRNRSVSGGTPDTTRSSFEAFTGRAALTFDITDQVTAYGQYAEIFQPNTFDVASPGGAALEPVTGHIYEVGVKSDWFDGKLGVNASIFRIERENVPIPDPNNGPGDSFSIPSGLQRADGIELEINGEPLPGWDLSFGGTLLDSRFIDRRDPNYGNSPPDVADWQLGFYTSYTLQSGPLEGFGLGAGLYAVDRRPVTASSSGTIAGYKRLDLQAFYKGFEPVDFMFQVRNVFDEHYVEALERPNGLNHFGAPRSFMATVRLRL